MEWWAVLSFLVGTLIVILLMGFPVAFAFLLTDVIFTVYLQGISGLQVLTLQIYTSISSFVLSPAPMFILMGEFMFHTNLANDTLDCLDRWLHRIPGRLGVLAATSGTIFAATSGSSMANTAMLGTVLIPEMRKRGYSTFMSVGPIIGAGGLAILIPPSALSVIFASIAQISVSGVLMGGVIPGVLLGAMFCVFIISCAVMNPACAPSYHTAPTPFVQKAVLTFKYLVPVGFIIFAVLGMMFLGLATPTEAAALGALATIIVSVAMGRFSYKMLKASVMGTLEVTAMVFMIVAASKTFSSVLAFTNATDGMVAMITSLEVNRYVILIAMQVIVGLLGCLMDPVSIMMVTLPIFMPIINSLGFSPIWFAVMMMVNLEMGNITPPFGMLLFVMQGVTRGEISFYDIVKAAAPYMLFDMIIIAVIMIFPAIALWLPSLVGQ
jgi:tripartite ATP-independent transporter DctM subunit